MQAKGLSSSRPSNRVYPGLVTLRNGGLRTAARQTRGNYDRPSACRVSVVKLFGPTDRRVNFGPD